MSDDIGRGFQFNTPIAAEMELVNELGRSPEDPGARFAAETAVSLLQPYAPHITEELWSRLGHRDSLATEPFPEADPALLVDDTIAIPVQVNGKVRGRVHVARGADREALEAAARAEAGVAALLAAVMDGLQLQFLLHPESADVVEHSTAWFALRRKGLVSSG